MMQPTFSPFEAADQVRNIGTFSCEGFLYKLDRDNGGVIAENLETGSLWVCSGDENTYWIGSQNF